jgi:hypothetical protein
VEGEWLTERYLELERAYALVQEARDVSDPTNKLGSALELIKASAEAIQDRLAPDER